MSCTDCKTTNQKTSFPITEVSWGSGKESPPVQGMQETWVQSLSRKISWSGKWRHTLEFLAEKLHGQGAWWATVYGIELDTTEATWEKSHVPHLYYWIVTDLGIWLKLDNHILPLNNLGLSCKCLSVSSERTRHQQLKRLVYSSVLPTYVEKQRSMSTERKEWSITWARNWGWRPCIPRFR